MTLNSPPTSSVDSLTYGGFSWEHPYQDTLKVHDKLMQPTRSSSTGSRSDLTFKKFNWVEELNGFLWSHKTTPKGSTNKTPFSLTYIVKEMALDEFNLFSSLKRSKMPQHTELNKEIMFGALDEIEEHRDTSKTRTINTSPKANTTRKFKQDLWNSTTSF